MWKGRGQVKRVSFVACGAQCTYAIGTIGSELYFFGITKQSGEATMRPQLVDGVSGWRCRSVAAGQSSTILSASYDHPTLITWGGSPTYGELGYGDGKPKSNTRPDEVQDLNGATILDVAMGYGHSLAIVKYDKKGKSLLSNLKTYSPNELEVVASTDDKKRKVDSNDDEEGGNGEPKKQKTKN